MVLAALAILIICAGAMIVGLIGRRRGTELHCSKCEHIVEGIRSSQCPECAADLAAPGATVRGGRHRNLVLVLLSAIGVIATGPFVVVRSHRALIAPGWQSEAPAWWLSQVELRFASGARFDQACDGVSLAGRAGTLTKAQVDAAGTMVFDRLRSQPVGQMSMHAREVFKLAGLAGDDPNCDVNELCRVVRACTLIPTQAAGDTTQAKVERPEFRFLPSGWEVKCTYTVMDLEGKAIGVGGGGVVSWTPKGRSSNFIGGQKPRETGTYRVIWNFELCPIGGSASATWSDRTTLVYDHEKASKEIRERLDETRKDTEARIKTMKEEKKGREKQE